MGEMVVILGGGESGVGAALLAKAKGFHVFLSDSGTIPAAYREELLRAEIPFEEEGHFSPVLQEAERVIKSPGIPGDHILVQSYRQRGVIVESEISFAARFLSGRIVGITGTNGKTTTTHLVDHLFRSAGFNTGCGGNIGYGMSRLALEPPKDWYVLELSSFQLEDTGAFRPDIAIILNLTPDHLDRYGNRMEAYADAKWNITLNQKEEDLLIFQAGNPYLEEVAQSRPSRARQVRVGNAAGVSGSWLEVDADRYDLREFVLQGDHNLYNTTCAILAARHTGIAASRIQQALPSFRPVRHRMEPVGERDGVAYINDSKATNVDAVWYALKAMNRPVIWIAGGKDKGNDYATLDPLVREKVRALVCLGLDTTKLEQHYAGMVDEIAVTRSMEHAVREAHRLAQPGDVVLLSPACASFDLFRNYEHRGDCFRETVESLLQPSTS